jgi:DNA-directed RNA polymerase specialized sigma24 family protein
VLTIEVNLTDEDAVPVYMKILEKVFHLRRLGMAYSSIAERLGVNVWMAKRAARRAKRHHKE